MRNVLFLINNLGGGGAERVLINLVNNMDLSKYEITVQTIFPPTKNTDGVQLRKEIHLRYGRMPFFRGFSYLYKILPCRLLFMLHIRQNYDVYISYLQGITMRVLLGAPANRPVISWIHSEHLDLTNTFFKREINKLFERFARIACVSNTVAQSFIHSYGFEQKVKTYYNTNDINKIHSMANEPIDMPEWQSSTDCIKIISLGHLTEVKGYDRLICALSALGKKNYKFKLLILGEGKDKNKLQELAETKGLADSVFWGGYRQNPYPLLQNSDLFVCSSRHEGLNTAMCEAMILGVPVISTRVSGASEVLGENSEYGLLVENNDNALETGLEYLLSQPDVLSHYRQKARERAVFFDTDATVKAVENLIDEVTSCQS